MPDDVGVLGDAVEDAAVAVWRDAPLERQLEVAELLDRNDVAAVADAGEGAVVFPSNSSRQPSARSFGVIVFGVMLSCASVATASARPTTRTKPSRRKAIMVI
jgi:hypothetical protein